jgi:hypothetical protein
MPLDDLDDPLELVGREWVERMRVLGLLGGARRSLRAQAGQLLTAVLLSV